MVSLGRLITAYIYFYNAESKLDSGKVYSQDAFDSELEFSAEIEKR